MTRVFIYGSCVTRDALETVRDDHLTITDYVARSSVGSALTDRAVADVDTGALSSAFQRRMVERDLGKRLASLLLRSESYDLVLHDPIDERFDLLVGPDGEVATRSNELVATGWEAVGFRQVRSGSEEHFDYWERGWERLVNVLVSGGKLDRLRVNRVRWSLVDDAGGSLDSAQLGRARRANTYLGRLYSRMSRDLDGHQFYEYPDEHFVADRAHRWGPSPFHFVPSLYQETITFIDRESPPNSSNPAPRVHPVGAAPGAEVDLVAGADGTLATDSVFMFRGRHIVYTVHARPRSRRLVLIFPGIDNTPGSTRMSYFGLGKVLNATVVHIKDGYGAHGSYLLSVAGDEQIRNGVIALIRTLQEEFDCGQARTWFIGTSKGATSAIAYGLMTGGGRVIAGEPQVAIGDFVFGKDPPPEWARSIAYAMLGRVDRADREVLNEVVPQIVRRYASRFRGSITVIAGNTGYLERHIEPLVRALQSAGRVDALELQQHTFRAHSEVVAPFITLVRRELTSVAPRGEDATST